MYKKVWKLIECTTQVNFRWYFRWNIEKNENISYVFLKKKRRFSQKNIKWKIFEYRQFLTNWGNIYFFVHIYNLGRLIINLEIFLEWKDFKYITFSCFKYPHYQQPHGQKSVLTLDTSKMESTFLLLQMNTHAKLLLTSWTPSQQHQSYPTWTRYSPNLACQSPSKWTTAHHSTGTN